MFTGLIEEVGQIVGITKSGEKEYFDIKSNKIIEDLKIGSSVACDGICLTVIEKTNEFFKVEAMYETLERTTAKYWQIGDKINLERALKASDRFEGHFVLGHVDTIAQINSKSYIGNTLYIDFIVKEEFYPLIVEKGSIAINGISLTIAKVNEYGFSVAFIGHTIENTNIYQIKDYVNLEFDILGKYIQRNLQLFNLSEDDIDEEWLKNNGF